MHDFRDYYLDDTCSRELNISVLKKIAYRRSYERVECTIHIIVINFPYIKLYAVQCEKSGVAVARKHGCLEKIPDTSVPYKYDVTENVLGKKKK